MKIAYFNCPSGISGDMMLSAIINSGVKQPLLESLLKKHLKFKAWHLIVKKVRQGHITATNTVVEGNRVFKSPYEIRNLIERSTLPAEVKRKSLDVFSLLISAESKVHGIPKNKVHFHELSSIDTLIDITGNILGLSLFGIEKVISSAINIGNPAPATLEILKMKKSKVLVYSKTAQYELATPTGIAIISTIAGSFGKLPEVSIQGYGFGAGLYKIPDSPDLLKLLICEENKTLVKQGIQKDEVVKLETNIDDMDPRVYPYLVAKLLESGALDVWFENISMKKGRPGILFSVLCDSDKESGILEIMFSETTTLGVRRQVVERFKLPRFKEGRYKSALLPAGKKKRSVEFEKAVKNKSNKPLFEKLKA